MLLQIARYLKSEKISIISWLTICSPQDLMQDLNTLSFTVIFTLAGSSCLMH